jgi:hypothetical protein
MRGIFPAVRFKELKLHRYRISIGAGQFLLQTHVVVIVEQKRANVEWNNERIKRHRAEIGAEPSGVWFAPAKMTG